MKKFIKKEIWKEVVIRETQIVVIDDEGDYEDVLAKQVIDSYEKEQTDCGVVNMETYNDDVDWIDRELDKEKLYLESMGIDSQLYSVITWPDSQEYMERPDFNDEFQLINDEFGLDIFGGSAFITRKTNL